MKLLLKRILSYFPTPLPVGLTQFDTWADSIIELSGEYADRDSMRFAIASMVIHSDANRGSVPKNSFVRKLRKSAANQVASQVFQDVKAKQEAILQAAKLAAAQQQEATAKETAPQSEKTT